MKLKKISAAFTALIITAGAYSSAHFTLTASADDDFSVGYYISANEKLKYKKYSDYVEIAYCDFASDIDVVIPAEIVGLPVKSIGTSAFDLCYDLNSVSIPDTVTNIGEYAFSCCMGFTDITIPDSVTNIGDFAFSLCSGLTSITLSNSLTSIGSGVFEECESLTNITLPESVTSIGPTAFKNCISLTDFTISENITSIGNRAFYNCAALNSVTILNPECDIFDGENVFSNGIEGTNHYFNGTIRGYDGSTAQAYAERYSRKFESLGEAPSAVKYGDANCDGEVTMADAVLIMQSIANPDRYGLGGSSEGAITEQGNINADCYAPGTGVTVNDALSIQKYLLRLIDSLPEKK